MMFAIECSAMSDYDAQDCLRRYFELVRQRPERFTNPPGDIYEILFEPARIEYAQAEATRVRRRDRLPSDDTRVGVLAEDPYLIVMRDAVRFADGTYGLYNRLMVPSGAAILPVLDGRIVLLHRFRHGTRSWHLEAPRGSFSGEGTHEDEARRELLEEIGARALDLIDLGALHSTTGCLDEAHHLYMAPIDRIGAADKHEAIVEFRCLTVAEMEDGIAGGGITDGPTLALFLRARLRGHL
jgi:ADP-ribose pyrophosphatase